MGSKTEEYMLASVSDNKGSQGDLPENTDQTNVSGVEKTKSRVKKRETWTRKIDFLLACIGFSVGLGNVWRFPFLCYRNGGGAFLIPYFLAAIMGGIPVFMLEVSLGQFMAEGGIGTWKICPLFQGIGVASAVIVFLLNCDYNIILTWAFYYLFASFTTVLPWSNCDNEWNTPNCSEFRKTNVSRNISETTVSVENITLQATHRVNLTDPVTEYWERKVLGISDDVGNPGPVKWDLCLCLLLAWIVVYFCIWKGIKSSGKVMYFTATSPYVLMFVLLVRGVTLDGAMDGIEYYLFPKWSKLLEAQVWVDAGTQVFFSYSISLGTLTALGSYNKFHHNCFRDCVIFGCVNSGTSFLAGFVIFSTLGFMAKKQNVSVADVAESGPGLAFIAYPEAVSQMPVSPLWAIVFFCMIILLGLDSQFVGVEGFITAAVDLYPNYLRVGKRREMFIAVVCVISFFVGLSMVTHGGMYVFQLFDYYSASRIVLVVALFECVVVAYIYGVNRFLDNIHMMLGFRGLGFLKLWWTFLTPCFTMGIFILGAISYSELTYKRKFVHYEYPGWAIGIGWLMALCSVVFIPIVMIVRIACAEGSFTQRIKHLIKPVLKRHQLRDSEDLSKINLDPAEESIDPESGLQNEASADPFIKEQPQQNSSIQ